MQKFSTIGLIGRVGDQGVLDSLKLLLEFFSARKDIELLLDEAVASLLPGHRLQVCQRDQFHDCDLVIVVGGDGSMLKVAPMLADQHIPVVGVNRGRLGFLTDILPEEIEAKIGQVLKGDFKVESRFLLEVFTGDAGGAVPLGCALNDVVLHPGVAAQMIEFELYIDDEFVYNQASDGLIVATPTGSTAYSMSAGGPIMQPRLDALVLVPMYPHSLSSRPIVIDANSEITLVMGKRHSIMPQISCDGSVEHTTAPGDRITIRKKVNKLELLHPANYNYYETCRSKLGWSHRLGKF
ncbi:MAG: NAD(+) kinase [Pseudomonadales bacterium]|nr:NAD(+) kinase [Pseudomonadales bacterium]